VGVAMIDAFLAWSSVVADVIGYATICFVVGSVLIALCPLGLEAVFSALEDWLNEAPR
jgi:hypothetical protein